MNDSQRLKLIKDLLSFFYKSFGKKKKFRKLKEKYKYKHHIINISRKIYFEIFSRISKGATRHLINLISLTSLE